MLLKQSFLKRSLSNLLKTCGLLITVLLLLPNQISWAKKRLSHSSAIDRNIERPTIRVRVQRLGIGMNAIIKGQELELSWVENFQERKLTLPSESTIKLGISDGQIAVTKNGTRLAIADDEVIVSSKGNLALESKLFGCYGKQAPGQYRGNLRIVKSRGNDKLLVINDLDIEDYLKGVVPSEAIPSWELEALKSQAVAARTYALREHMKNKKKSYDLLDTPQSQRYKGARCEHANTDKAVEATVGEILTHRGIVILAMYSSNTGRHGASLADVYPDHDSESGAWKYLRGRKDKFSAGTHFGGWEETITLDKIREAMTDKLPFEAVYDIKVSRRTRSGRVEEVDVYHQGGVYRNLAVRTFFKSALKLKDLPYKIKKNGDSFTFFGSGNGHGLGMSQWGSQERAKKGIKYRAILGFSYAGVRVNAKW